MTDSAPTTSEDLALAARKGCRASYEELVRRHHERLYQFLLWRCHSVEDAEDLTQETFLLAWRKLHHYRPRWRFHTWLYTLGWRLAVSRWRRRSIPSQSMDVDLSGHSAEPHEIVGHAETVSTVWRLAERLLSRDSLTALWLHYGEDLAMDEVGRILGRRTGAVRVLLHRARRKLATHRNGTSQAPVVPALGSHPTPRLARTSP